MKFNSLASPYVGMGMGMGILVLTGTSFVRTATSQGVGAMASCTTRCIEKSVDEWVGCDQDNTTCYMEHRAEIIRASQPCIYKMCNPGPECALPCIENSIERVTPCSQADEQCIQRHSHEILIDAGPCRDKACGVTVENWTTESDDEDAEECVENFPAGTCIHHSGNWKRRDDWYACSKPCFEDSPKRVTNCSLTDDVCISEHEGDPFSDGLLCALKLCGPYFGDRRKN